MTARFRPPRGRARPVLGSVAEAEDVVQEAFLRYTEAGVEPDSRKAYLTTITTRLAIDQLRSARARREVYPGEWPPEPLVEDEAARHADRRLALARLPAPAREALPRRARGLPREVFDYPYEEVAAIVGKTPETARQILARAHQHVQEGRRRYDVSREEREEVARRFLAAWEDGDTEGLVRARARASAGARERRARVVFHAPDGRGPGCGARDRRGRRRRDPLRAEP